ncbi:MAG TPA: tRNA-(ms[2]io[6]A)-hydroxylase [Pirellulales bacterium]|jgi:tRNA-(ms[2]io[6]A)-hydroxylase|nr:tRNA-(ms[2]io[6]A)-hydroxylase [Pirellulales bacterium]
MLSLHSVTDPRWVARVNEHLEEVLIDHAHCEKKAAGAAMNLIFAYVDQVPLVRELSTIVVEELDHFRQVIERIEARGIRFRHVAPSRYGQRLHDLVRKDEPGRAIDRLIVAGLIEARSCERFALLRDGVNDSELASFYGSLFESEARHHSTYLDLARLFADDEQVRHRLHELAEAEAAILGHDEPAVRMHS